MKPPEHSDVRGRLKVTGITTTQLKLFGKNRNRSPSAIGIPLTCHGLMTVGITITTIERPGP
jgi:hypothetical protein